MGEAKSLHVSASRIGDDAAYSPNESKTEPHLVLGFRDHGS